MATLRVAPTRVLAQGSDGPKLCVHRRRNGPHPLWAGKPASALRRARVGAGMTLAELAHRTSPPISITTLHAMEVHGAGSPKVWRAVAEALGVEPQNILPPGRAEAARDARQLALGSGAAR